MRAMMRFQYHITVSTGLLSVGYCCQGSEDARLARRA
jgi:hypothetical protein